MTAEDALEEALESAPVPDTASGLVALAGGENRDLALLVAGLPAGTSKLPADTGSGSARRTYDNTMRSLQRYRKSGGGEQRGQVKPEQLGRWQAAARPLAAEAFIKAIRRRGCRCRVYGAVFFISDKLEEVDSMPVAGRPGALLTRQGCQAITDAYRAGDMDLAVEHFTVAFTEAYSFESLEAFDEIDQIVLWLDGQGEP